MATELGQAYIQIMPSMRGIKGKISQGLDGELSSAGQSAGTSLGLSIAAAAAVSLAAAGIGKVISASIMEGADLQQSMGGIETLFKSSADKVKGYAAEAYRTAGLSANDYMETVTSFSASLLQSLGGDTSKAADTANMALTDMSDNANKMGTSMELIQNAYQGFAKQNYTMLDNLKLGYGGTKTEMERLLADAEKLTGVKYDINNLADVYNAIHAIQGELGITGTTAKEAASTFTGSFNAMKASFQNVLGGLSLGQDITPHLQALASTTSNFLFNNFFPMVGNILKGLPSAIGVFIAEAGPQISQGLQNMLSGLGANIDSSGISSKFQGVVTAIQPVIDGFKTAFGQLPALFQSVANQVAPIIEMIVGAIAKMDFSGVQAVIEAFIPALISGFETFMSIAGPAIEGVVSSFTNLWNAIQPVLSILSDALMPVFNVLGSFLGGVFSGVLNGVKLIFDGLAWAITALTPAIQWIVDGFSALEPVFSFIAQGVGFVIGAFTNLSSVGQGVTAVIKAGWSNIQSAISVAGNVIGTVINFIKGLFNGAGSAVGVLRNLFSAAWSGIQSAISVAGNVINAVINTVKSIFTSFGSTVSSISNTVKSVINGVKNTFNSLANINLAGAGQAIMNGFLGGLKSAWKSVTSFVGGIADWIKKNKGPISYDKVLLIPAGQAIMNGLKYGLGKGFESVKSLVSDMAGSIYNSFGQQDITLSMGVSGYTNGIEAMKFAEPSFNSSFESIDDKINRVVEKALDLANKAVSRDVVLNVDGETMARATAEPTYRRQKETSKMIERIEGVI